MNYYADTLSNNLIISNGLIDQGRNSAEMLARQNEMIRRSRSRLYRVDGALGISQSTMRSIRRRVQRDRVLVVVAIILLILVFVVLMLL